MNSQGPGSLCLPPLQSFTLGSHIPDQNAEPSGDSEWSDHHCLAWSESWENHWRDSSHQSPQHCDYFRWLLPSWVTSLVDETARTLGRYDDHSLLQFQSFLGRFFSRILVRARFNLHFIPALPVCEIKKMEIQSLRCPPCLWPEIVLSIENLNEKWGQRRYRFKISNFYSYCMTILIHFLQPSSCKPIVMEKSPHSSSLLLSMAFSRSDLQKQTWFQLTDRRQAPVSCQTSSRVSYKAGYELAQVWTFLKADLQWRREGN